MNRMSPGRGRTKRDPESGAEDSDEYRKKRDRNNLAVKRSRVKSKQKTEETLMRVNQLRNENTKLEEKVKNLNQQLGFLKELFLAQAADSNSSKFANIDLQALLADDTSETSKQ